MHSQTATKNKTPLVIWPEDIGNVKVLRSIPNLGNRVPEDWTLERTIFVGHSGFGQRGERAITPEQFAEDLTVGKAYGITEVGQFQLYVGEFQKDTVSC